MCFYRENSVMGNLGFCAKGLKRTELRSHFELNGCKTRILVGTLQLECLGTLV